MVDLTSAIPLARNSVAAVLRIWLSPAGKGKKRETETSRIWGSDRRHGICVVNDRYLVTAHHVFNNGATRAATDKFYAFIVPNNGLSAFYFPVVSFPLEDSVHDLAVIEIGPCTTAGQHLSTLPITTTAQVDGTPVMTIGFPSPVLEAFNVDAEGNYAGGNMFLKSYANEGIISGQFVDPTGVRFYELNVDWHHGESGGPIFRLNDPFAVFSVMQAYRPIQGPHGVIVGPHHGRAIASIESSLRSLGASFV